MLKEYFISDIFPELPKQVLHHACAFEKMDQSRLVWPHKCDFYSIIWFMSVVENILHKKPDSGIEIDLLYFYSLIVDKINDGNFDPGGMITPERTANAEISTCIGKIFSFNSSLKH